IEPVGAVLFFNERNQLLENFSSVADQGGVHRDVLVDLRAVDFDVYFASAFRVSAQIAGDAIIEAHADGDEEIRFLNGVIDPGFAVHAHHAEVQWIVSREAADTEQRHGDGEVAGANKLLERFHRAGDHDAVPCENQGALGRMQKFDRSVEVGLVDTGTNALGRQLRSSSVPVEFGRSLLGVFGDV